MPVAEYSVWDTDSGERSARPFTAASPREAAHKSVFGVYTQWPACAGSISVSVRDGDTVHVFRVRIND
jgi:hypothetical protein